MVKAERWQKLQNMGRRGHCVTAIITWVEVTIIKNQRSQTRYYSRTNINPALITMLLLLLSHFSHVRLCGTPQTAAHQAPPSLGFSRQEHWSGLPFPSPMHESEK